MREYRTASTQFIGNEVPFYCPLVELQFSVRLLNSFHLDGFCSAGEEELICWDTVICGLSCFDFILLSLGRGSSLVSCICSDVLAGGEV